MPIRPLNTLIWEELLQLLNTPEFYGYLQFAYYSYHLRRHFAQLNNFSMPIRPLNTLTWEEVLQLLLNTPEFYVYFEFVYDMYDLRQRFAQLNNFVVPDPLAPVITPGFNYG
jgi:hypothetical protein